MSDFIDRSFRSSAISLSEKSTAVTRTVTYSVLFVTLVILIAILLFA